MVKVEVESIDFVPETDEEKTELARKIEWFKEFTKTRLTELEEEYREAETERNMWQERMYKIENEINKLEVSK